MGGENETSGSSATGNRSNSVWYANLSSSGIGSWSSTTAYPSGVFFPGCFGAGRLHLLRRRPGLVRERICRRPTIAAVSPYGLGPWTASTGISDTGQGPVLRDSHDRTSTASAGLAAGGTSTDAVYYAGLSPSGIGAWQQGGSYPTDLATDLRGIFGLRLLRRRI